jgi:hypothetical protein
MDCTLTLDGATPDTLFAWHFGALGDAEATAVETHLAACPACLRALFALKHDVERSPAARPRALVRARTLRAAGHLLAARRAVLLAPRRMAWALAAAAGVAALVWHGLHGSGAASHIGGEATPAAATEPARNEARPPLRSLVGDIDSGRLDPAPLSVL